MRRVHSLLFIVLLTIALSSALVYFPLTPILSGPEIRVSAHGLVDDDGQELQDDADVELNMMFFAESAPNDAGIHYACRRGADTIAYFGMSRAYYCVDGVCFSLEFPGSNEVIPAGEDPTGSITNYLLGNAPSKWRTGQVDCLVLRYREIYPGIDLAYRILDGHIKYEFIAEPNADTSVIALRYSDADTLVVRDDSVFVSKDGREMEDAGLWAFQRCTELDNVPCAFRVHDSRTIGFSVGKYDTSQVLIIDPVIYLAHSTFLGGESADSAYGVAVASGCVYVTGRTYSSGFPTVNAYDSTYAYSDGFVTKFAADGLSLVYSTFLGGSGDDFGSGIAVEDGCAYVTGLTRSSNFPIANAYDSTINGGDDCFVTKFAADGQSLVYSTFLGGASDEYGYSIAVEGGCAYVTGFTASSGFPTINAYDFAHNGGVDCFVTKFADDGQSLVYSTFLGGASDEGGRSIAVESGCVYVTGYSISSGFPIFNAYDSTLNGGYDCFVTKFAADGQSLVYSTFLGGESNDYGYSIAVEGGCAYVSGFTASSIFPTINAYDSMYAYNDCFVTKFADDGLSLVYSTFLGGGGYDDGFGIVVEDGCAYVTGLTRSSNFPIANAYDSTINGGDDCFVTKFAADGQSLVYSTFLGGASDEYGYSIAVEGGCAYVVGTTGSSGFPNVNAYDSIYNGVEDIFVSVLSPDSDMDGLLDCDEIGYGTDPFCIDSDNDNFLDGYEVAYGSNASDPMSYPDMPQTWYDAIYEDLNGNATLIQHVISWLDGNHTAIETLFTFLKGNATLLIQTVNAVNGNSTQLDLLAALVTQDIDALSNLNATHIGDMAQIRDVLDLLGTAVGDTDYDGLDDLDEIALGTDIQCIDTDCDNLNDAYEVKIGTDPNNDDSDGDTYYDGAEVLAGTDPLDSHDYPSSTSTNTTTLPPIGLELIIITGAAGCVVLVALLVVMRRRAGAGSSS